MSFKDNPMIQTVLTAFRNAKCWVLDPKRKKYRPMMIAGAVVVVAGLGLLLKSLLLPKPPAMTITTAMVQEGDIQETVLASGTLKPAKLVAVGSQASGRVMAVNVKLGQIVKKGDLLAQIDSVTQENALRNAQAALADARAQRVEKLATLELNEQTLARQTKNYAAKAISKADYESAVADVKTVRAQIASLDAQIVQKEVAVKTAEADLGYTHITAPIGGTVLAIVTQEGQTVNAVQSAPTIVILGQLDVMTIRAEISEADVVKVRPEQEIYFTILGDTDRRYQARLASIEPAPESIKSDSSFSSSSTTTSTSSSSAIYYMGTFNVPNEDGRLRTYMTAEVHIVLGEAHGVLTVPSSALSKNSDGSYVVQVVERDGRASMRKVVVGLNDKINAQIRSGLQKGERVITGTYSAETTAPGQRGGPPPMGL